MAELVWIEGRSAEALDYAERAMASDPLDWELKAESINKYMAVGDYKRAEQLARSIVDHDADYVPGLQALGNLYWRTGRHVEAFRVYHRLLEINPRTVYIMERIAVSFLSLGDTDGAMRWLDRAAEINSDEVSLERINVYRLRGDSAQSIELLQRLLEAERADSQSTDERVGSLERDLAVAQEDWTRFYALAGERLERLPQDGEFWLITAVRHDLALAADRLGRTEERDRLVQDNLAGIKQQRENGGDNQYLWLSQARSLALLGDAQAAAIALERAFEQGFRSRLGLLSDQSSPRWSKIPQCRLCSNVSPSVIAPTWSACSKSSANWATLPTTTSRKALGRRVLEP